MIIPLALVLLLQQPTGEQLFRKQCASCHGEDGHGGAQGPGLAANRRVAALNAAQLRAFLERGNVANGMPAFSDLSAADLNALVTYVRRVNIETILGPLPTADPARKIRIGSPQPGDWITYNGNDSGNRYSRLEQITRDNVAKLQLKWVFPIDYFGLETTPLAVDGVIYVTGPNQVTALDALTGELLWHYSRPATPGLTGDA